MEDTQKIIVGKSSAVLMPNRPKDRTVDLECTLPGIVILVHGVNDLGNSYYALDNGLCQGLNERLNRNDLFPNDFLLPAEGDAVLDDPDKVYYRMMVNNRTNSPVIPFYWGYRAAEDEIAKERVNGQIVDKHGNRLDKNFAKGGGMFVNATNNIPDMFSGHYKDNLANKVPKMAADVAHPLNEAADRHYMALAAKRLAALVRQIRLANPGKDTANETVTLLGHSQGCLVSLLAQAYLLEEGDRRADCLILCHPPYGVHEPWLERFAQAGQEQQTTAARIKTLANLVKAVTDTSHASPLLDELIAPAAKGGVRAGHHWTPVSGKRPDKSDGELIHAFAERSNRGHVYLYFCPHDLTVGLANVEGIGTFGVPDHIDTDNNEGKRVRLPVLDELGTGFKQRVWTWRSREGAVEVGSPKIQSFTMRMENEPAYDATWGEQLMRARANVGETRQINAEPLNPPWKPFLHVGEVHVPENQEEAEEDEIQGYVGKQRMDPIDAAIAVSNSRIWGADEKTEEGKAKIKAAHERYQTVKEALPNSYHSSIVANPAHHRWVTAMDVAIGQAKTLDDPDWRALLLAIADWRTDYREQKTKLVNYDRLDPQVKELVEATATYYFDGIFPAALVPRTPPPAVVKETVGERNQRISRAIGRDNA